MASSKSSRPGAARSRSIYSVSLSSSSRREKRDHHHHHHQQPHNHRSLIGEPVVSREDSWRPGSWPLVDVVVPSMPLEPVLSRGPRKPAVIRRRSAFGRLTSFLSPSLNSGATADIPYSTVQRKPLSAAYPVAPPHPTQQQQHQYQHQYQQPYHPPNPPPNYNPGGFQPAPPAELPPGLGIYSAAQPPPAAHLASHERPYHPPPPAHENTRGRNGHRVPTVIQKAQKHLPQAPPPPGRRDDRRPAMPEFKETPASPPTPRKSMDRKRSNSFNQVDVASKDSRGARLQSRRRGSPSPAPNRQRSVSAHSPSSKRHSQHPDPPPLPPLPSAARPQSSCDSDGASSDRVKLRRSWLHGGRSRSNSQDMTQQAARNSVAWVLSPDNSAEYSVSFLVNGEKVRRAVGCSPGRVCLR